MQVYYLNGIGKTIFYYRLFSKWLYRLRMSKSKQIDIYNTREYMRRPTKTHSSSDEEHLFIGLYSLSSNKKKNRRPWLIKRQNAHYHLHLNTICTTFWSYYINIEKNGQCYKKAVSHDTHVAHKSWKSPSPQHHLHWILKLLHKYLKSEDFHFSMSPTMPTVPTEIQTENTSNFRKYFWLCQDFQLSTLPTEKTQKKIGKL